MQFSYKEMTIILKSHLAGTRRCQGLSFALTPGGARWPKGAAIPTLQRILKKVKGRIALYFHALPN